MRSDVIIKYRSPAPHVKNIVADGAWVTMGTADFDHRNVFLGYERTFDLRDTSLCASLQRRFPADLAAPTEVQARRVSAPGIEHSARGFGWLARRWS